MGKYVARKLVAFVLSSALTLSTCGWANDGPTNPGVKDSPKAAQPAPHVAAPEPHRFWDRTNLVLFTGVVATRALDYTSTGNMRALGHDEILFTNSVVDNKPLFAGIEAAGAAFSLGVSYWLHRTAHHKLERWVSIVHIGVGRFGVIRNYSLGRVQPILHWR